MKVSLERKNEDYHFEAIGSTGIPVQIDNSSGTTVAGASPTELLLMGVGGCSAIDVVSILKKQRQEIVSYRMEVEGSRKKVKEAKPFDAIVVRIFLEGEIDAEKAKRAAQLSFDKYCSVSLTMEGCVEISHEILLNGILIK